MQVYGACGEIPRRTRSESAGSIASRVLVEAVERRGILAEDLEEDGRTQARRGGGLRGGADEAAVADRRDAGAEALPGAELCDRAHVVERERVLAPDVQPDPRDERQPVAEARIDGVLDVRVAVDEAGDDHAAVEALPLAELGGRADGGDPAVVGDRDGSSGDRLPLDRDDPVGGEDSHRNSAASASAAARSQRRSIQTESQIESSKRTKSGTTSSTSETGSTVGRRIANESIAT